MNAMRRNPDSLRQVTRSAALQLSAVLAGCAFAGLAVAQSATPAKPAAPAAKPSTTAPATRVAPVTSPARQSPVTDTARTRIELPAAERAALENSSATAVPPAAERNELLPQAEDAQTTIVEPSGTVIEQVRQSNRISEVRVTPALTGHTWVMTNREGRQPIGATDTQSGLSVPKFFTFEFGATGPRQSGAASAPAAPPPPSTQSR